MQHIPESYGFVQPPWLGLWDEANTVRLNSKAWAARSRPAPCTDRTQDDTRRLKCALECALVRRDGQPSHFVASHGVLSTHHRSPLRGLRNPLVRPLPHPRKVITRSCPEIKTATAGNNSRVPLSVCICLSLSLLPEYPIRQASGQRWRSTKPLCFHLGLFWLSPRLFL